MSFFTSKSMGIITSVSVFLLTLLLTGCAVGFNKNGEFYCTEGPTENPPSCFGTKKPSDESKADSKANGN